jgi:hypothetical protein
VLDSGVAIPGLSTFADPAQLTIRCDPCCDHDSSSGIARIEVLLERSSGSAAAQHSPVRTRHDATPMVMMILRSRSCFVVADSGPERGDEHRQLL